MKKYLSFFRIRFISGLQYRMAAFAGIATQFAWGGMTLLMFAAFYRSGESVSPMEFNDLSSYIWLQQALLAMFMAWFFDGEILESVASGSIAYELCRPCDLYTMWLVKNLAIRLSRTVLRCLPILVVAAFLPPPFDISLPHSVIAGVLFMISAILGVLVLISFAMLIYISAFYTVSSNGIRVLAVSTVEFFSGGIVPIPFFPDVVQPLIRALPFASMQNTPLLIYIGNIGEGEAVKYMALQLIWLCVLTAIGRLLMKHALGRVVVQGG